MLKELATLKIEKNKDYYNEVVKALKESGFTVVETLNTYHETDYMIAKEFKDEV